MRKDAPPLQAEAFTIAYAAIERLRQMLEHFSTDDVLKALSVEQASAEVVKKVQQKLDELKTALQQILPLADTARDAVMVPHPHNVIVDADLATLRPETLEGLVANVMGMPIPVREIANTCIEDVRILIALMGTIGREDIGHQLPFLQDVATLTHTYSRFHNAENVQIIESVAEEYPMTAWMEEAGITANQVTRDHLDRYWNQFTGKCKERGLDPGGINPGGPANLWKASFALFWKVQRNPRRYNRCPLMRSIMVIQKYSNTSTAVHRLSNG